MVAGAGEVDKGLVEAAGVGGEVFLETEVPFFFKSIIKMDTPFPPPPLETSGRYMSVKLGVVPHHFPDMMVW